MRVFNETFCNENNKISKTIVVRTIRFEESDSVNRPKFDRPATATNENKVLDILQSFVEDKYIYFYTIPYFYKLRCTTTQN